jgi:hypothetical protein
MTALLLIFIEEVYQLSTTMIRGADFRSLEADFRVAIQ